MDPVIESTLALLRAWRVELLLVAMSLVLLTLFFLVIRLFSRLPVDAFPFLGNRLSGFEQRLHHIDGIIRDELTRDRQEASASARELREELRVAVKDSGDALLRRVTENAGMQKDQLDSFSKQTMELR